METSDTILKIYLLIVLLGALYGIVAGLVVGTKKYHGSDERQRSGASRWKTFIRGVSTLVIVICFIALFSTRRVSNFGIILSVFSLLFIQEYLLRLICDPQKGSSS